MQSLPRLISGIDIYFLAAKQVINLEKQRPFTLKKC